VAYKTYSSAYFLPKDTLIVIFYEYNYANPNIVISIFFNIDVWMKSCISKRFSLPVIYCSEIVK